MTMTPRTAFSGANYWPDEMAPQTFYDPVDRGFEAKLKERLAWWDERRQRLNRTHLRWRLRRAPFRRYTGTDHQSRVPRTCTRPNRPPNIGRTSSSNGARASCSRSSSSSRPTSSPRRCSGRSRGSSTRCRSSSATPAPAATASARNWAGWAYWLVWLVGLIAALQPLGLSGVLTPVTSMTNEVFAFLPRLLGAGLFFFAGLILARIVRHIIEAALGALNLERLAGQAGLKLGDAPVAVDSQGVAERRRRPGAQLDRARGRRHRVGDDHHLRRHRRAPDPADLGDQRSRDGDAQHHRHRHSRACLRRMVWLAIAFLIGKWVKTLIETVLPSLGFDDNVRALGIMPAQRQSVARHRHRRDDRDPARRGDRGGAAIGRRQRRGACCSRSPSLAARSSSAR